MTLETKVLDVTTITSGIIIQGVNCQGAMGSGLALALMRKWPIIRERYIKYVNDWMRPHWQAIPPNRPTVEELYTSDQERRKELLGQCEFISVKEEGPLGGGDPTIVVVNCFTQHFAGSDGKKYADVASVNRSLLEAFTKINETPELKALPVYLPQIGCGLGGLNWETDVKPLVDRLHAIYPEVNVTIVVL